MSVFKAYDIRGLYPKEIDEKLAYKVGRAATLFFKTKKIAVGRDCRLSSPALAKSLIYGITDQGADVIDIGMCSTPMGAYAAEKYDTIIITASHNPKEYNGIKLIKKGPEHISEHNGLKEIEKISQSCHFPEQEKKGTATGHDITEE